MSKVIMMILGGLLVSVTSYAGLAGDYRVIAFNGVEVPEEVKKTSLLRILTPDEASAQIIFIGSEWTEAARNDKFYFTCKSGVCERPPLNGMDNLKLVQTSDAQAQITGGGGTYTLEKVRDGGSTPGSGTPWVMKESTDITGARMVTAYKKDENSGATLVLSCRANTQKVIWSLNLSEKTYLAAQGAVVVGKGTLQTLGKVNAVEYQIENWSLSADNYLVAGDSPSSGFLRDLKEGNSFQLRLQVKKASGEVLELESMNFQLNGSRKAITELEGRCSGAIAPTDQILLF